MVAPAVVDETVKVQLAVDMPPNVVANRPIAAGWYLG